MNDLVWGFFYGGSINPEMMQRRGMKPQRQELATLFAMLLPVAAAAIAAGVMAMRQGKR